MRGQDTLQTPQGLTQAEADRRLKDQGPNELPTAKKKSLLKMASEVVREPMVALLMVCAAVYLVLGEKSDGILLSVSVLGVVGLSLYQQSRSTRALEALRDLSSPRALVVRDGQEKRIPSREVVPGDLLVVNEGDRIAADARLIEAGHLQIDESLLTGESHPVAKRVTSADPPGAESMIFGTTLVTGGFGMARVTATGAASEVGKIGRSLGASTEEPTRLQQELGVLVRRFGFISVAFSLIVALAYGFTRGDWPQAILAGIAAALALLPEELPVMLTIFLALGAWRLSRKQVLVRQTAATENLGGVTVLCVDKTGTLTLNRMTVRELRTMTGRHQFSSAKTDSFPEDFHALIEYGVLASHKDPFDPMEKAIRRLRDISLAGTEHIHPDWILEREYPLTPELLAMSCVWKSPQGAGHVIASKGAPEAVIDLCHLGPDAAARVQAQVQEMSEQGLRVIGVAKADFSEPRLPERQHDFEFLFLGLIGLEDPVRPEVPQALAECYQAGVRVLMITGDHPGTAARVAEKAGLREPRTVLTGSEIERMSDPELARRIREVHVFARMVPAQKLRLVNALKADGQVVAMTGDGVNDAPSLKWADIGIAMGGRGTDVAREAADLVLLDDHFISIVAAIRLGRRIFENIRRALSYIFAVHVPIAGLAIAPALFGWPLILWPAHIVFLELIIDPTCTLLFEAEAADPEIMKRPPRRLDRPLFSSWDLFRSGLQGGAVLLLLLLLFAVSYQGLGFSAGRCRAVCFTAFVVANIGLIVINGAVRAVVRNSLFWIVSGAAFAFLTASIRFEVLRRLFGFDPIGVSDAALAVLVAGLAVGVAHLLRPRRFL